MQKWMRIATLSLVLLAIVLASPNPVASKVGQDALVNCRGLAYSTEEDFVTQGPEPPDGNPIISDGDLLGVVHGPLGIHCEVCARNGDLLQIFQVPVDLGLDAVDVIDVDEYLVALSTELDSSNAGQFTAGDLLVTNGAIIPNQALTAKWGVPYDLGLDGLQFVGDVAAIKNFLDTAKGYGRDRWLEDPSLLASMLKELGIDIWFSTEGTWSPPTGAPGFLDGDLLSAGNGVIVIGNAALLPPGVPAGIPNRGVDFGLDAVATDRSGKPAFFYFSTEILYDGEPNFTDGDVLQSGDGVVATNWDLISCFGPKARMLGLDALSVGVPGVEECTSRIDRIGGVDVANISLTSGMVVTGTVGINAAVPFGGQIDFQGNICDDVTKFRLVYRKVGSADPWEPIKVPASKNWTVKVDAFFPPWPDCLGAQNWSSDADGWFSGTDYRLLSHPATGCNPDLSLTVWESTGAIAGADELYEVILATDTPGGIVSDTVRLVQLDNTLPTVELEKTPGTCDAFTSADMPLMISGRMKDAHFYMYQLAIGGDGYASHSYTPVRFYDSAADNVIDTGTINWNAYKELHNVNVFDLAANPVKCGYAVSLTGWDRTLVCGFTYPSNWISRCVGCRYVTDLWTFEYTP